MSDKEIKTTNVADQQDAVSSYLEALLTEVGFGDPVVETEVELESVVDQAKE